MWVNDFKMNNKQHITRVQYQLSTIVIKWIEMFIFRLQIQLCFMKTVCA